MGSVTLLDRTGDSTLAWSDENDDNVRAVIERKMTEGWSFFILKPRIGGLIAPKRTPLKKFKELPEEARAVSMSDADFMTLLEEGFATKAERAASSLQTTGRAKTAAEAARADTVAVKPRRGG